MICRSTVPIQVFATEENELKEVTASRSGSNTLNALAASEKILEYSALPPIPFLPHPGHGACRVLFLARVGRQTRQAGELTDPVVPVLPGAACAREGRERERQKKRKRKKRSCTVLHVINVSFKRPIPCRSTIVDGDQETLRRAIHLCWQDWAVVGHPHVN